MSEIQKKPITQTLRNMSVSDEEVFPIAQCTSIYSTIYNNLSVLRADGWRYKIAKDISGGTVTVTRIA